MVTASHNPAPWNGLKFLDHRGLAPDAALARELANIREQRRWKTITAGFKPAQTDDHASDRHAEAVCSAVEIDLGPIRGSKIVLDSINGAGSIVSGDFLRRLGCDVVHINGQATGDFVHAPEPVAENLVSLSEAVRRERAVIGFAQDPDADRLAIVDEQGRYIGEEYTLALATWSTLLRRKGSVAANLSTSRLIDAVAHRFGVPVYRTPVGEANVARAMLDHACVVGGEGNGGVIDPRFSWVRDSLAAMSLVLQLVAATGKRISELVAELPALVMIKQKAENSRERIAAAVDKAATAFANLKPDRSDGVRIDFPDGWVHLRASNTEPIVRLIAEAASAPAAEQLVARVRAAAGL
jgi:phosphomannomutase